VQIDQDWENLRSTMPAAFWDPEVPPGIPLHELYFRQLSQISYYMTGKHVHLPYMLRASTDKKFEPSRQACLEASRNLMRAYHGLRKGLDEHGIVLCDTLDFQVFSAGIIVAVDVLTRRAREGPSSSIDDDILLVEHFAGSLAHTAALMECSVAGRGASLLRLLASVGRGTYTGPRDSVDVQIPYFGRLRITFPQVQPGLSPSTSSMMSAPTTSPSTTGYTSANTLSTPVTFSNSSIVEFGLDPLNFQFPFEFDLNAELNADWTALMDFDPSTYGWADSFDLDQLGPGPGLG
jgi:hypothetical protein